MADTEDFLLELVQLKRELDEMKQIDPYISFELHTELEALENAYRVYQRQVLEHEPSAIRRESDLLATNRSGIETSLREIESRLRALYTDKIARIDGEKNELKRLENVAIEACARAGVTPPANADDPDAAFVRGTGTSRLDAAAKDVIKPGGQHSRWSPWFDWFILVTLGLISGASLFILFGGRFESARAVFSNWGLLLVSETAGIAILAAAGAIVLTVWRIAARTMAYWAVHLDPNIRRRQLLWWGWSAIGVATALMAALIYLESSVARGGVLTLAQAIINLGQTANRTQISALQSNIVIVSMLAALPLLSLKASQGWVIGVDEIAQEMIERQDAWVLGELRQDPARQVAAKALGEVRAQRRRVDGLEQTYEGYRKHLLAEQQELHQNNDRLRQQFEEAHRTERQKTEGLYNFFINLRDGFEARLSDKRAELAGRRLGNQIWPHKTN
jgi:hypothetical protein